MTTDAKSIRRYHAGVERALGLWDATNEWADYIAFLSRLAKALQTAPPDAEVPLKSTIAKYLAQCLKPSLPSGVHQKALEIYNLVFSLVGTKTLAQDLSVWLPGLSHTLTFATLTTRPLFLALFEDHLLKLSSHALRPALKAIILSLLPGIEEETSEDFDRTLGTLNKLKQIFAKDGKEELFWQSLFLASVTSKSRRPGALVYLIRHLPRLRASAESSQVTENSAVLHSSQAAIKAVTSPEPGLLVRCFATGLQDEQQLVQRGFLDLLVSHLPLEASTLQNLVSPDDLDVLVSAAMTVVLRRDMSLNRRLWTWFIGGPDNQGHPASTMSPTIDATTPTKRHERTVSTNQGFVTHGLPSVIRSLQKMLHRSNLSPAERARPFRVMLSLLDRWEIGSMPVLAMFIPALQDLQKYQSTAPSQSSFDDVFRSANVFFDAVEPQVITGQLFQLLHAGDFDLLEFIMANFNLQDEEMTTVHLPMFCLAISEQLLGDAPGSSNSEEGIQPDRLAVLLDTLLAMLSPHSAISNLVLSEDIYGQHWSLKLKLLYEHSLVRRTDIFEMLPPTIAAQLLLRNLALLTLKGLTRVEYHGMLAASANGLNKAVARTTNLHILQHMGFGDALVRSLRSVHSSQQQSHVITRTIAGVVDVLAKFDSNGAVLVDENFLQLVPELVTKFWDLLLPSTPQYHVEAVDQIWNLYALSLDLRLVESTIAELMCPTDGTLGQADQQLARFSTFWNHTRFPEVDFDFAESAGHASSDNMPWTVLKLPVLSIVDYAKHTEPEDRRRQWLSNLPSLRPIFHMISAEWHQGSGNELSPLTIHRMYKVMIIAKQSAPQRSELYGQAGVAEKLLELCTTRISAEDSATSIYTQTLAMLGVLVEEMHISGDHDLVKILLNQLSEVEPDSQVQARILDLLHGIFSKPDAGSPPSQLLQILMKGIANKGIDSTLDKWITLLCNTIALYPTQVLFATMLKLTACLCNRAMSYFSLLQQLYMSSAIISHVNGTSQMATTKDPERSINNLLAGLEYMLVRAHTYLVEQLSDSEGPALTTEKSQARSMANHRLTVILCMQDAIKLCGEIWAWRLNQTSANTTLDTKSFSYVSSRLRSKTRRILEHLSGAEPQECLETFMGMWVRAARRGSDQDVVLNLMQSLAGARPKIMIPATFNAIYSRTNPSALDEGQKSSLSVDITAAELMGFLMAYTLALEDDLLEEIWTDCTAFLREVLSNPMPHRQILLLMLEFVAVLCQKMENTNFGEVSKMRREMGDLCARLFTAIFTIKPAGLDVIVRQTDSPKRTPVRKTNSLVTRTAIEVLCGTLPIIGIALGDQDKLNTTLTGIATNVTGPALRSRQFPQTVNMDILELVLLMAKAQPNNKTWRKDVLEAINDSRFFQATPELAENGWIPVLRQLCLLEKGLVADLLSRTTPPTSAGIMFGVGATAARKEADWKTQLNLRRIALMLLSNELDNFTSDLSSILRKVEELLTATAVSSPSSSTRGDIYLVLRAMILTYSQAQLVSMWAMVDMELRELLTSMQASSEESMYNNHAHLQGAKLLDLLLLLKPEEFQLHEWLFVTDTVDAIYPPHDLKSVAIADQLVSKNGREMELPTSEESGLRRPWLCAEVTRSTDDPDTILRPFFRQLSIHAFEDTYSLQEIDLEACRKDLLADLFSD